MCLLEGLAMGKPVIAPESVGMVPEFAPSEQLLPYPAGDAEALTRLVTACFERKRQGAALVQDRTWDRWAEAHHHLFARLLEERGTALPRPGPAFRFGMLGELEVPPGAEVDGLEAAVDRAAAHLYFGEHRLARVALATVAPRYPCVEQLLGTFPADDEGGGRPAPPREKSHLKALR